MINLDRKDSMINLPEEEKRIKRLPDNFLPVLNFISFSHILLLKSLMTILLALTEENFKLVLNSKIWIKLFLEFKEHTRHIFANPRGDDNEKKLKKKKLSISIDLKGKFNGQSVFVFTFIQEKKTFFFF